MLRIADKGRRRFRGGDRRGGLVTLLAVVGAGLVLLLIARVGIFGFDMPDWLDGGKDDPAARGQVIYEGQAAESASERFLIDIGDGESVVAVRAKQDHDSRGWWLNGDFQSTNGTSSVRDPDNADDPARLRVAMDYCAEGTISTETDDEGTASVTFDMGEVFVCGSSLPMTRENAAAFHQDDTPADFHGDFVSFVAGAAEATAAAAECPTEELAEFADQDYVDFVRQQLSEQLDVPEEQIEVIPPTPGSTDPDAQDELRARLDSFANRQDPDDPDREYEALDIQYLSSTGSAVEDSCWREPGGQDLDDLDDVDAPQPEDR